MTTNAKLLDRAMSRLGSRSSPVVRAKVVQEINATVEHLERGDFFPWFLDATDTLNVVAEDTMAALPGDFAVEREETRPYYVEEGKVFYLTKRFYGQLVKEVPVGIKYYSIVGNDFFFRGPADKAYSITLLYSAKVGGTFLDDALAVSNLWLLNAEDWVLGRALKHIAALHLRDTELASILQGLEEAGKRDVYVYHEMRQNINQDFEIGGASDGT